MSTDTLVDDLRGARSLIDTPIRFVIFVSYGNDSIALIQWARENELSGVAIVYTDTGWAAEGWPERVEKAEAWALACGFRTYRTSSIGFRQLARDKKGFPTQRYQWCSFVLKIQPGERWLAEHDPDARAVAVVGVRRDESADRADFPEWMPRSGNHGGRVLLAPFATYTVEQRNELIIRSGWDVLPHRSRECRCINSNRRDMRRFTDSDVTAIREIETEIGRPMFRPHRHQGATGIEQVMEWARANRGKYDPDPEPDLLSCGPHGYCEVSGRASATPARGDTDGRQ